MPKDDKNRLVHETCQDDWYKEVSLQEFDVVSSKVFNFYSIRSVIITRLKTKAFRK